MKLLLYLRGSCCVFKDGWWSNMPTQLKFWQPKVSVNLGVSSISGGNVKSCLLLHACPGSRGREAETTEGCSRSSPTTRRVVSLHCFTWDAGLGPGAGVNCCSHLLTKEQDTKAFTSVSVTNTSCRGDSLCEHKSAVKAEGDGTLPLSLKALRISPLRGKASHGFHQQLSSAALDSVSRKPAPWRTLQLLAAVFASRPLEH